MPTISIYLPDTEAEALEKLAESDNRSASNMVATLVKEAAIRKFQVVSTSTLPHPADAVSIPLVSVVEVPAQR
jgi:hypothetical protein